jgi:carboxyl-terminal processing protease
MWPVTVIYLAGNYHYVGTFNAVNADPNQPPRLRPRRLRPPFLLAFCFVFGLGAGVIFDRWELGAFVPSDAMSNFHLIASAWNIIERNYVDRSAVTPQNLTYGAIAGMVDALGDTGHSTFLAPRMVKQLHNTEQGQLKGVGLEVQEKNRQVVIEAPIDNSPAQRAGLRSGEIILSINGHDIAGLTLNQAVQEITGPVGTPVKLSILNPQTRRVRDITLIRAEIKIHDVTWQPLPGTQIADVRIAGFDDDMSDELRSILREIQREKLQGLVLDLRDNPGGVLDEAISVASQFLANGNVMLIKDAHGDVKPVPVIPGGLATNLPMAILVNQGSASAAEIVAGALRDAHRGELIGETTFGTGTVLNEFKLPGGAAILLAVEEWLTPSGESFWHKGITPQIAVDLTTNAIPLVPAALEDMTPDELQSSTDDQLLKAIQWVQGQIETNNVSH